jgi:hypothetical protein
VRVTLTLGVAVGSGVLVGVIVPVGVAVAEAVAVADGEAVISSVTVDVGRPSFPPIQAASRKISTIHIKVIERRFPISPSR